jgi:predicted nucleotidyltransferase
VHLDFVDLLRAFSDAGVRFVIVGAHALAVHGRPRATGDLDVWVEPTAANAVKVYDALAKFGAPLDRVSVDDFARLDTVFQIGVIPVRIDILTKLSGVPDFAAAYERAVETTIHGVLVRVLGRDDFVRSKRASGRRKDLQDVEQIERMERLNAQRRGGRPQSN